jgi:hypothetical protein
MKYKLIKTYPGFNVLGTIIEIDSETRYYSENNEFWQPVVEKDYEILSVITNDNEFIVKVYNQDATIEPYWKIHSVKRLSDGEIFTIGDKVTSTFSKNFGNFKIEKIKISENSINIEGEGYLTTFQYLQKVKQPLFTTEDGVNIFEDDNIYWVNINTFSKVNCNKYNDDLGEISIKSLLSKKYECKAVGFSTKEKAEEYILMNKPCLSLNDVQKIITSRQYTGFTKKLLEEITTLVNSKLK